MFIPQVTAIIANRFSITEANPKGPQSSGPTGPAVAIAAVGLGVGYWIFGSKSHGKG